MSSICKKRSRLSASENGIEFLRHGWEAIAFSANYLLVANAASAATLDNLRKYSYCTFADFPGWQLGDPARLAGNLLGKRIPPSNILQIRGHFLTRIIRMS